VTFDDEDELMEEWWNIYLDLVKYYEKKLKMQPVLFGVHNDEDELISD
jgi:hypothetical protein